MSKYFKSSRLLKTVALLVPLTCFCEQASAQVPIAVSAVANLHFGSLVVGATGGTATIDTSGGRTTSGTVTGITGLNLQSEGQISVSGSTGLSIALTVIPTSFTLDNGGDTMTVNNFNLVSDLGGVSETITLTNSTVTYPVGARLNIPAIATEGTYTGSYTIRANYL